MGNVKFQAIKVLLFAFLMLLCRFPGFADMIRWDDGSITTGSANVPLRTVEHIGDEIIVTYEFGEYGIIQTNSNLKEYMLSLPDFSVCSTPGNPAYLFKKDFFNVPTPEGVSVELVDSEYQDFNIKLAPAQPLQRMNEDYIPDSPFIVPYEGFIPSSSIDGGTAYHYRGNGVVEVMVTPALYSATDNVLRLYKKLTYKVTSSQDEISLLSDIELPTEFGVSQNAAVRPDEPIFALDVTSSCLIISVPEYADALKPFIEWKQTLGIPVHAAYSSNWTTDEIKNVIKETYDADPKLNYLLFVGDQSTVPAIYWGTSPHAYNKEEKVNCYSDFEYTCITNECRMPEVTRGRLPVNNVEELKTVVTKIVKYEKTPVEDVDFYKSGVIMSYLDTPKADAYNESCAKDTVESSCFIAITEEIYKYLTSQYGMDIDRLYSYTHPYGYFRGVNKWGHYYNNAMISEDLNRTQSFWDHGSQDFVDKINEGRCFGLYLAHGNWDCFYNTSWFKQGQFDFDKIESLNNGNRLPFIIAHSCLTGNFAMDNVANKMLTHKNGGCIGYFGATNSIYIMGALRMAIKTTHSIWEKGKFETAINSYYSPSNLNPHNNPVPLRAGEIFDMVIKDRLAAEEKWENNRDSKGSHYFGDPTMYFRITTPAKPTGISVTYSNNTINIESASEPYNIAFYDSASGQIKCWYGLKASYETLKPRSVSICVYGPNSIPYVFHYGSIDQPVLNASDMTMACSNKAGLVLSLDLANSIPSTVTVTNLSTQVQNVIEIEGGCEHTEIALPSAGNYGVTLVGDGTIIQTEKIQITQ